MRLTHAIGDGSFFENKEFLKLLKFVKARQGKLHLMGLLSDIAAGDNFENITYALVVNQLQITDNSGTETLIDNVVNLQFRYFKENDTDTPTNNDLINGYDLINYHALGDPLGADDRLDIRTVEISITVEEPAGREGMIQRTYNTRVRRRNADL